MFKLKTRYTAFGLVSIPFSCDPVGTVLLYSQKASSAASAVFQVSAAANFIDSAAAAARGTGSANRALLWFVLLAVSVGWRRISPGIGRYFSGRVAVRAQAQMCMAFTEKRAKLHYRHIENHESWDLTNRVCTDVMVKAEDMLTCLGNLLFSHMGRFFGILIIVTTQVWWMGLVTISVCVVLVFLSIKSGAANYNAHKAASQFDRKHQYLSEVLTGRER
ncbi:MAG: hypothetical protein LBR85_05675 [Oscillospiraceae bacterium]|jgi:ABC-type multidrug transport system fused ATPase/permease subunit|nr:hypothetical protein [Oscillospiraceae bacterium]